MYRNVLLITHVAMVAAWLGANFVQLFLGPWFAKRPVAEHAAWVDAAALLGKRYYNVAGIALGVSGVLLVLETSYEFSAGFVGVGIGVVLIGAILGITVFVPAGERQAEALRTGDADGARQLGSRLTRFAVVDTALVLMALVVMVTKWRA